MFKSTPAGPSVRDTHVSQHGSVQLGTLGVQHCVDLPSVGSE